MIEWKSMDSAPRDGTPIFAKTCKYGEGGYTWILEVRWVERYKSWESQSVYLEDAKLDSWIPIPDYYTKENKLKRAKQLLRYIITTHDLPEILKLVVEELDDLRTYVLSTPFGDCKEDV